ncbi:nickel pincer cofactor biosynthesis protein LarB [Leptolyngbya sp. PCC 6406]|uniref:nickel pincer cofactor biosynthesis protein LarB n=1 Tax=Leptolyngbya sp. PCC 6406 TaxID=1173264 RepID=UPI0002ACD00F|nr:nickel pincer cofactor biosynthesis protein LarB [Leptolyngbya sp. PCC 6406]
MTQPEALRGLLEAVAQGQVSPDRALDQLRHLDFEPVDTFAKVDHHRTLRTGFPEGIWGPGKTVPQIVKIMEAMRNRSPAVIATRIEPAIAIALKTALPDLVYYETARICALGPLSPENPSGVSPSNPHHPGIIGIVTAGTADLPVAEEAAVTAELCGFRVERLWDVGVAGLHRLLHHRDLLTRVNVLIVVAGMEGALPSVVAGLVDCPVVAVPTSIGYGASFGGIAPLLTMLNSCAPGIGVVNIDNGFGAAILAGQILRAAVRLSSPTP